MLIYLRNVFMSRAYIDMKIDMRVKKKAERNLDLTEFLAEWRRQTLIK